MHELNWEGKVAERASENAGNDIAIVWTDYGENRTLNTWYRVLNHNGDTYPREHLQYFSSTSTHYHPDIVSAGGAEWFTGWFDCANDEHISIVVCKVNDNGNRLWRVRDCPIEIEVLNRVENTLQLFPDSQGGCYVIVFLKNEQDYGSLCAYHILADGDLDPEWEGGYLELVDRINITKNQNFNSFVQPLSPELVCYCWISDDPLSLQANAFNEQGEIVWGADNLLISENAGQHRDDNWVKFFSDGLGKLILTWNETNGHYDDLKVQILDPEDGFLLEDGGEVIEEGIRSYRLNSVDLIKTEPGKFLVAWSMNHTNILKFSADDNFEVLWDEALELDGKYKLFSSEADNGFFAVKEISEQNEHYLDCRGYFENGEEQWNHQLSMEGRNNNFFSVCDFANDYLLMIREERNAVHTDRINLIRLSPDGDFAWGQEGHPLLEVNAGRTRSPHLERLHDGRTIADWQDYRFDDRNPEKYYQILDDWGLGCDRYLQRDGEPLPDGTISSDGCGSGYLTYKSLSEEDSLIEIRANKINHVGEIVWGDHGVICNVPTIPEISDVFEIFSVTSNDETMIAWSEKNEERQMSFIHVQRLDNEGQRGFAEQGMELFRNNGYCFVSDLHEDSDGGFYLVRRVYSEDGQQIQVGRYGRNCNWRWQNGVVEVVNRRYEEYQWLYPERSIKHPQGVISIWKERLDDRGPYRYKCQFVTSEGELLWNEAGYTISEENLSDICCTVDRDGYIWILSRVNFGFPELMKLNPEPDEDGNPVQVLEDEDGERYRHAKPLWWDDHFERGRFQIVNDGHDGIWCAFPPTRWSVSSAFGF